MEANSASDDNSESDSITAIELQKTKRVLFFSDGTMEELSESDGEDIDPDVANTNMNINIDPSTLPLGPFIKYRAYEYFNYFLSGVEYVGEGLANFLGITSPKYVNEYSIEHVNSGEPQTSNKNNINYSNGWLSNNNPNTSNIVITRSNINF